MKSIICKSCKSVVSESARFCPNCGRETGTRFCVTCGAEVSGNARFCGSCGKETINHLSSQPVATMQRLGPAPQRVQKRRSGLAVFLMMLFIIGIIALGIFFIRYFDSRATTEENGALWNSVNIALTTFVGDNLAQFMAAETSPITPKEIGQVTQQINNFDKALKAVEAVKPPRDQIIVQEMLIPMYRRIFSQMVTIKGALVAGDPLKIDLEVQRLQLLLEELGGALEMLTLETA